MFKFLREGRDSLSFFCGLFNDRPYVRVTTKCVEWRKASAVRCGTTGGGSVEAKTFMLDNANLWSETIIVLTG